jgi:hypothetical protein
MPDHMHVPVLAPFGQGLEAFLHWIVVMHVPVTAQIALPEEHTGWHAPTGPALGFHVIPFAQTHWPLLTIWVGAQQIAAWPGIAFLHW